MQGTHIWQSRQLWGAASQSIPAAIAAAESSAQGKYGMHG